jgi:hypothetical protein
MSEPSYTAQDEAIAEHIVATAMKKYRSLLPAHVVEDMSEYLVDELLATADGRRKLSLYRAGLDVDISGEVVRVPIKKPKSGGEQSGT